MAAQEVDLIIGRGRSLWVEGWAATGPVRARHFAEAAIRLQLGIYSALFGVNIGSFLSTLKPELRHEIAHFQLTSLDPGSRRKSR